MSEGLTAHQHKDGYVVLSPRANQTRKGFVEKLLVVLDSKKNNEFPSLIANWNNHTLNPGNAHIVQFDCCMLHLGIQIVWCR